MKNTPVPQANPVMNMMSETCLHLKNILVPQANGAIVTKTNPMTTGSAISTMTGTGTHLRLAAMITINTRVRRTFSPLLPSVEVTGTAPVMTTNIIHLDTIPLVGETIAKTTWITLVGIADDTEIRITTVLVTVTAIAIANVTVESMKNHPDPGGTSLTVTTSLIVTTSLTVTTNPVLQRWKSVHLPDIQSHESPKRRCLSLSKEPRMAAMSYLYPSNYMAR